MDVPRSFLTGPCGGCPQRVVWANTGKAMMPVDPEPAPGGDVVLLPKAVGAPQAVVTNDPRAYPGHARYTSHWDTCPNAEEFRRPRPKPPPPQTETLF